MPNGGVNSQHCEIKSRNRRERVLCGRFFPQGAGAVVNANNKGRGFSVARGGTAGLFTVKFDGSGPGQGGGDGAYPDVYHVDIAVAHATLVHRAIVTSLITNAGGGITGFTFQVYNAASPGVAVDVAAAATSWISFIAHLQGTTVPNV